MRLNPDLTCSECGKKCKPKGFHVHMQMHARKKANGAPKVTSKTLEEQFSDLNVVADALRTVTDGGQRLLVNLQTQRTELDREYKEKRGVLSHRIAQLEAIQRIVGDILDDEVLPEEKLDEEYALAQRDAAI